MSTPLILPALLASTAVTVATIAGWLLAALAARWLLACRGISAPSRAVLLAQARLLPLASVAILVPTQIHAFVSYEADRAESAGPMLISLGLAGLIVCVGVAWRGLVSWRDTAHVVCAWKQTGREWSIDLWTRPVWTIRAPFPVVAVVGALRPQLFVARQVVEAARAASSRPSSRTKRRTSRRETISCGCCFTSRRARGCSRGSRIRWNAPGSPRPRKRPICLRADRPRAWNWPRR